MAPLVTIVIPTYNRAEYVLDAIQSALDQTEQRIAVIVVDDGSTDTTGEVVRRTFAHEPRLKYVRQDNQGRSQARNLGASLSDSEFIGFLDSDDRLLTNAIAAHLDAFGSQASLGLTIGGYDIVDPDGKLLERRRPWDESEDLSLAGWLFNCYGTPGSVLMRRSWFSRVGGFDTKAEISEDWDLFLRLAADGCTAGWVRESVYLYRQHPGNSITALDQHRAKALYVLDKLLKNAELPLNIRALAPRASAWVNVQFARKALASQKSELTRDILRQAATNHPDIWTPEYQREALEFVLAAVEGGSRTELLERFMPANWQVTNAISRKAWARSRMQWFFRHAHARRDHAAATSLAQALADEPVWILNRGVLAFLARLVTGKLARLWRRLGRSG